MAPGWFVGAQSTKTICLHWRKRFCPQCPYTKDPGEQAGCRLPSACAGEARAARPQKFPLYACHICSSPPGPGPEATPSWPPSNQSTPEQFIPFQNANNSNYRHNTKLKQTHFRHSRWSLLSGITVPKWAVVIQGGGERDGRGRRGGGRKREKGENDFSKGLISFPLISLFTFTK